MNRLCEFYMLYAMVAAAASQSAGKHDPMFISRSESFKFVAGETIHLPCEVSNTASYMVAWKRGLAILSAGSVKVTPDPRIRLYNGFSLQIRDASTQDAGDYICTIQTLQPIEITHTVEILVPPKIESISSGNVLQVRKGNSVRIDCKATGDEKLISPVMTIEAMDRHKGGTYICTADNGVGEAATTQVNLHVLCE
ncbi:Neuronal growth regulator 1 [Pseudolycoriella hygida]|uniref:Neuronal growth regulator 1 n=1 Tax=Pseudolycoriella hygida TaxID=35572 RepID=A0A9Q0RZG3_9DIPT|nr:Neuronal growth regulator 1 [Pseudolycoriella hygida]